MPGNVRRWIGRALRKAADHHIEPQGEAFPEPPKTAPDTHIEKEPKAKPRLNWDIPPEEQKYALMRYGQGEIEQVVIFEGTSRVPTDDEIFNFCRQRGHWGSFCLFSMRPRRKLVRKLKVPEEPPFEELPWETQRGRIEDDWKTPLVDDPWNLTCFSSNGFSGKKVIGGKNRS